MGKKNKKKKKDEPVFIPYKNRIEETNRLLHRLLKIHKLQGLFTVNYSPITEENLRLVSLEMYNDHTINVGSFLITDNNTSDFKQKLKAIVSILVTTRQNKTHPKVGASDIINYFCDYYFNEHKDEYKLRINRLDFANMVGLIFTFIGLLTFSTVLYCFMGFNVVLVFLLFIGVLSSIFLCRFS